jgi:hypothetical protein
MIPNTMPRAGVHTDWFAPAVKFRSRNVIGTKRARSSPRNQSGGRSREDLDLDPNWVPYLDLSLVRSSNLSWELS